MVGNDCWCVKDFVFDGGFDEDGGGVEEVELVWEVFFLLIGS